MIQLQHPPKKVLIVDDEPAILRIVGIAMRNAGHEIGTAGDGLDGLKKFREQKWDVIITDRAMPRMDGEEMTAAIKAIAPDLPVILITGLPDAVTRATQYEAILGKPFRGQDLQVLVENALRRHAPRAVVSN